MDDRCIEVIAPGTFTTLQDSGRLYYQSLGVPVSGASDRLAFQLANALAGNPSNTGALEFWYSGPTLLIRAPSARIALAGSVSATIETAASGRRFELAPWRSTALSRGDRIAIGGIRGGTHGYLAVEGGFDIAPVLGSVATHCPSRIGGFSGGKLAPGEKLRLGSEATASVDRTVSPPDYGSGPIRVMVGPQAHRFTEAGIQTFLSSVYTITTEADRMGIRLDGPRVEHVSGADLTSEGTVAGSVQVPGSGMPIILMSDRQTVGGYTKVATVISADLPRLAQMAPGSQVSFAAVTIDDAERLRRGQELMIERLLKSSQELRMHTIDVDALARENVIGGVIDALSDPL